VKLPERRFDAAGNLVVTLDARGHTGSAESVAARWLAERGASVRFDILAVLTGGAAIRADFWNPDGSREPFCGNALRCVSRVLVPAPRGEIVVDTAFSRCTSGHAPGGWGRVSIPAAVVRIAAEGGDFVVDPGTPHRVRILDALEGDDCEGPGHAWSAGCEPDARINATFVQRVPHGARVRTFERGVGETGSCGTGAIAAVAVLEFRNGRVLWPGARTMVFRSGHRLRVTHDGGMLTLSGRCKLLG